jgi:hypothetical protein
MMKQMKNSILSLAFAGLLASSAPSQANVVCDAVKNAYNKTTSTLTMKNLIIAATFGAALRFWTRDGNNSPVRYNLDELLVGENVQENLWYLMDDGVIGHAGKKPKLKVDESGEIEIPNPVYPKGLMGWTHFYWKPILSAIGTAVFASLVYEAAKNSSTSKDFVAALRGSIEGKLKELGISKLSDLGVPAAAGALGYTLGK